MKSAAYQQASSVAFSGPEKADPRIVDPENRLLWRANIQRLEAEQIRDAMLFTSGWLSTEIGGKTIPLRNREFVFNHTSKDATTYESPRRALYLPIIRNHLYDMLEQFDYPDPTMPTGSRNSTVIAPQALIMMNAPVVMESASRLAARLASLTDDEQRVEQAYALLYGRPPAEHEKAEALALLREIRADGKARPRAGRCSARHSSQRTNSSTCGEHHGTIPTSHPPHDAPAQRWRLWLACIAGHARARDRAGRGGKSARAEAAAFPARAKRVIFLFMKGGPSHVDTFDPKPLLAARRRQAVSLQAAAHEVCRDRQAAEVTVELQAIRPERAAGERAFPERRAVRGRPLHPPLAARHESRARRRAAETAHRQRHAGAPEHGLVGDLRTRHGERESARLHHDLPDARARRREQLGRGISARVLPGHADRQCEHPVRQGARAAHPQRTDQRRDAAQAARFSREGEPRASRARPGPISRWKDASIPSNSPTACRARCPRRRT